MKNNLLLLLLILVSVVRVSGNNFSSPLEKWSFVVAVEVKDGGGYSFLVIKDSQNLMKDESTKENLLKAFNDRLVPGKKERWLYAMVFIDGKRFERLVDMDKDAMEGLRNGFSSFELRPDFHFVK